MRALVVDDAPEFVEILVASLRADGYDVSAAASGELAVEHARVLGPDVIVLDVGLPGIDGIETCRRLRTFTDAYIVMLTARDDEVDKLVGLSVGADDYMTKPFSPRELLARVRAMMRRPRPTTIARPGVGTVGVTERVFGDLRIDIGAREVHVGDRLVDLTKLEFDILEALSTNPKVVLTRAQLIERVWGADWYGDEHVVDVHLSNLRKKLGDDPRAPRYVVTVRGVGFRLAA